MMQVGSVEVALGLGSNIGDKQSHIAQALAALQAAGIVADLTSSRLYRTEPFGPVAQDWFVNICAVGRTDLPPPELLTRIKSMETALGRIDGVRWGPRVIDIDILYYDDVCLDTPSLRLPHAGLLERAFVLVPLAELRPKRMIGGVTIEDAADRIDTSGVTLLA